MTTQTTYTVLNRHGSVQERGCSLIGAANVVMGYDGHEFEVRQAADGQGYELWTSTFSRNSTAYNGLTCSRIFSLKNDRDEAELEICELVIRHAEWFCGCEVLTDAEYDALQAEIARDAD